VLIGLQPRCYLAQETLARLNARLSGYVDVSAQRFAPIMGEAKEGESLGPFCPPLSPLQQAPVEAACGRLLGGDVQPEGGQSLFHFSPKSFGVSLVTKYRYKVIRETR
jgi:hypothetical protein